MAISSIHRYFKAAMCIYTHFAAIWRKAPGPSQKPPACHPHCLQVRLIDTSSCPEIVHAKKGQVEKEGEVAEKHLLNFGESTRDAPAVTSTDHHTLHLASCLQYLIHCLSFISRLRCLKDILNSSWNLLLQSIELLFIEVQRNSAWELTIAKQLHEKR